MKLYCWYIQNTQKYSQVVKLTPIAVFGAPNGQAHLREKWLCQEGHRTPKTDSDSYNAKMTPNQMQH